MRYRASTDSSTVNLCQGESCYESLYFSHTIPNSLSTYTKVLLTAFLYYRITIRIGMYTKYPVNLSFCTIDLSFGIANLPFRIDSGKFGYTTGILGSTPPVEIKTPLQWKYESPPQWTLGLTLLANPETLQWKLVTEASP